MGTIEVKSLGMKEAQMETIADFMARIIVDGESPEQVLEDVVEFRVPYQAMYDSFEEGLPPD